MMKNLFAFIAILGMFFFGTLNNVIAQDDVASDTAQAVVSDSNETAEMSSDETTVVDLTNEAEAAKAEKGLSLHKQIKQKFIEGGAGFMGAILLTLIIGLALAIERIIYLNLASTNTEKLLTEVEEALNSSGVEAAKEVCRNTKGPVASIFYQGLDRMDEGIDVVEKAVVSYGGVQMGLMEKGLTWISLMISIAPMLGFMGTVIGMIGAFDAIQAAGTISPALVAGGIKVALITTVAGLIIAIILQIFYNLIVSQIDGIVNKMEDASISLVDILIKYNLKK